MTEFDIQFELDWEKYSIFNKGRKSNARRIHYGRNKATAGQKS